MKEPLISVQLRNRSPVYAPGASLEGEFQIDAVAPEELRAVEVSVLWHTEGKGDEDVSVHFFERFEAETAEMPLHQLRCFETRLPTSPFSYDGFLIKIRWCVRLRVFLRSGKQSMAELEFRLGNPPVRSVTPPRVRV